MFPGSTPGGGELSILSSNANWVLDLVPNPDKTLPGEVDRCLTGSRGMIHVSGEPLDYQKKKKKQYAIYEKSKQVDRGNKSRVESERLRAILCHR